MAAIAKDRQTKVGIGVLAKAGMYIVLLLGLLVTVLPFVYIMLSAFKTNTELIQIPPTFLPAHPTLSNFTTIFTDKDLNLPRFFFNSLFVSLARVAITLFTSSFAGYIFAKYDFRGKTLAFWTILVLIMIPFQVVMIPNYLILARLGLMDTLWALIVPTMVDAFGIFMMKQFIESLPSELLDAARIDGSSEFGIYSRVALPQMGAPLASLGIFTFMATWNDYLWPLIVITSTENRTLPLLLTWYDTQHSANHALGLTGGLIILLPIMLVYIFLQRWIVDSATQSAFK